MNPPAERPAWLVVGARVLYAPRDYCARLSGPYAKGTFNAEGAILVVVEIRVSPRFGGHIGVLVQTTGLDRRYAGRGKWLGFGHLTPAPLRVNPG